MTLQQELNSLTAPPVIVGLMELSIPPASEMVRLTDNGDPVWHDGYEYLSVPMSIGSVKESIEGSTPSVTVTISNVDRVFDGLLQEYDFYRKQMGDVAQITATLKFVNARNPVQVIAQHYFVVKSPVSTASAVSLTFGARPVLDLAWPPERIRKSYCNYRFKGDDGRCGYAGAELACDNSYSRCVALGNAHRFGGFRGIGKGAKV